MQSLSPQVSFESFSVNCLLWDRLPVKTREPSLPYYLRLAEVRRHRFMPLSSGFQRKLTQQTRTDFWNQFTDSTFNSDTLYTTWISVISNPYKSMQLAYLFFLASDSVENLNSSFTASGVRLALAGSSNRDRFFFSVSFFLQ